MESENIYTRIREIFGHIPENLSILQEQIDIDLQMEYYDCAKNIRGEMNDRQIAACKDELFLDKSTLEEKKNLLVRLASQENIEIYRAIEKYLQNPDPSLRDWAVLALQECRMLIETNLLDQNQVFISTGLGGKGSRLRYFIVLLSRKRVPFNETQKRVIRSEFDYLLGKHESELEDIQFYDRFVTMIVLIPLHIAIKDLFQKGIEECNQFGNFLRSNFLVTNVKFLSPEEITHLLDRRKRKRTQRKKKEF